MLERRRLAVVLLLALVAGGLTGRAPLASASAVPAGMRIVPLADDDDTGETSTAHLDEVDAGDTIRTHAKGTLPTSTRKLVTEVVMAAEGEAGFPDDVELEEVDGYRSIATVEIDAPDGTDDDPMAFTFRLDLSTLPDRLPPGGIALLKDGEEVEPCEGLTVAAPDPCLLDRSRSGDVLTVTALSSTASTWTLAQPQSVRLAGDDPVAAAVQTSRSSFGSRAARAVVLVRSDDYADALAGAPLAMAKEGPLLLSTSTALDDVVLDEIRRVLTPGRTVYLLGGTAALSDAVAQRLDAWGYLVTRYAGPNRYATAVVVAERGLASPSVVIETTGLNFADALAAGALASHVSGAVLLTAGATQATATREYIVEHRPTRYALGGPAAVADPGAVAIVGADRYETAVLGARRMFSSPDLLTFTTGEDFPDGLAGGAHAGLAGAPMLLLPSETTLPISVQIYLRELADAPTGVFVYGSTSAVPAGLVTSIVAAIDR